MRDGNIAFRNYGDQPHGGDIREEKGENHTYYFLARIQNHFADHVGRRCTSNTQISRRQGKNKPVGCCLQSSPSCGDENNPAVSHQT